MLRVLTYHRVIEAAEARAAAPGLVSASPRGFARHMEYVARRYQVVSLERVLEAVALGRELPEDAVLVTFDDAYRDFADVAWPILRRMRMPVTLFVPTAYPDRPERTFWWDRLAAVIFSAKNQDIEIPGVGVLPLRTHAEQVAAFRQARAHLKARPHTAALEAVEELWKSCRPATRRMPSVLRWDELRRLSAAGVTIAPHTRTHPLLTRLAAKQVEDEIAGSLADVRREIGACLPVFCYPSGDFDDAVVRTVAQCGIRMAFTVQDGHNDLTTADPLRLHRTNITPRTTPWIFRIRLTRTGAAIDTWRHGRRMPEPQAVAAT